MQARPFTIRTATWRDDEVALRWVRTLVFVEEQEIDAREEFDDADKVCQHLLALDAHGKSIGTCRVEAQGRIGRVAVLAEWRKAGIGRVLLQNAIDLARINGMKRVHLNAQVSALGFYERAGFAACGERFLEAGIEHLAMELEL